MVAKRILFGALSVGACIVVLSGCAESRTFDENFDANSASGEWVSENLPVPASFHVDAELRFTARDWSIDYCSADRPEDWSDFDYGDVVSFAGDLEGSTNFPYAYVARIESGNCDSGLSLYFYRDASNQEWLKIFVVPEDPSLGDYEAEAIWFVRADANQPGHFGYRHSAQAG